MAALPLALGLALAVQGGQPPANQTPTDMIAGAWLHAARAMVDAADALGDRRRGDFERAVSMADMAVASAWYWTGVAFGSEGPPKWALYDSPQSSTGLAQAWYVWARWSEADERGRDLYEFVIVRWRDALHTRADEMRTTAATIRRRGARR